jgi:hypothetical protein
MHVREAQHEQVCAAFAALRGAADLVLLERDWATCEIGGVEVGVVGTKGFVGGFEGSHLPDVGEPLHSPRPSAPRPCTTSPYP